MRTFPKYVELSLDKFDDESMACVNECRQAVGYQEDPAWNCPYIVASQNQNEDEHESAVNDFLKKHEGKRIGGILCHTCLVKESHDQHAKGITPLGMDVIDPDPFPLTNKPVEKFSNERCVELCNIINTAVAEERIVMADSMRIVGAFPNYGILCCILHAPWGLDMRLLFGSKDKLL
jgi:hypothetical protein